MPRRPAGVQIGDEDQVLAGRAEASVFRVKHHVIWHAVAVHIDLDVELGRVVRVRAAAVGADGELEHVGADAGQRIGQVTHADRAHVDHCEGCHLGRVAHYAGSSC